MYFILLCIELLNVCMWNVHNVNTLYGVYDVMHYNVLYTICMYNIQLYDINMYYYYYYYYYINNIFISHTCI